VIGWKKSTKFHVVLDEAYNALGKDKPASRISPHWSARIGMHGPQQRPVRRHNLEPMSVRGPAMALRDAQVIKPTARCDLDARTHAAERR